MKKVWHRAQTGWWYVSVQEGGVWKQLRLIKAANNKDSRKKAEELAIQELATRKADPTPSTASWITVNHVLDGFLRHSKENHEQSTFEWYEYFFSSFKEKHGKLRITLLKKHHIHSWLSSRKFGETTKNRAIGAVKRAFAWAVEEEHIARSPIEHIRKPQGEVRDRVLTMEERALILDAIRDPQFKEYVIALGLTGARPGEIRRVRAEDVDLARGCWILKKHKTAKKTGKPRMIYLCPEALELTKRLMATVTDGGPLFRNTRGKPWSKNAVRLRFTKLRKRFPQLKGVISYTYRASFATDALEQGIPDATVAALLGHTNTNTLHRFYARLSHKVAHLQDAAAKATQSPTGDAPQPGTTA